MSEITKAFFDFRTAELTVTPKPRLKPSGFGRVRMPNPGSRAYGFSKVAANTPAKDWKTKIWQMPKGLWFRSQGQTSQCVRYGITHALMLFGISRRNAFNLTEKLYEWAQRNDAWAGEEPSYFGTSVDAGLQFCLHYLDVMAKSYGTSVPSNLCDSYWWAKNMDEALTRLTLPAALGGGVLIGGSDFYSGMDGDGCFSRGDPRNHWEPSGELWGGHCTVIIGTLQPTAKRSRKMVIGNSHDGNYVGEMDADAFEWLFFAQGGELAAMIEHPLR